MPPPTQEQIAEALAQAEICCASQEKLLRAARSLLLTLQKPQGISSIETLVPLLKPLFEDYAKIERKTRAL